MKDYIDPRASNVGKSIMLRQLILSYKYIILYALSNNVQVLVEVAFITAQLIYTVYLGQMLIGFTVSWAGPIVPKLRNLEQSPLPFVLTETQLSFVGSLTYVGSLPGPFVTGWLSNVKGRKPCILLGGLCSIISFTILATANNLVMIYFGRVLSGFASGITAVMNLVYIGEIASTHIRGILLTAIGIFTTVGSILVFSTAPFLSYSGASYCGLALSIVFTASTLLIPESPIYYILKDDEEAVKKVLHQLGRLDDADKILASKKNFMKTSDKKDWIDLFVLKSNRRALAIVLIANICQHCSGIIAVLLFASTIFEMAGSSIDINISMIIIACCQFLGSSSTPLYIERAGRKILLIVSCSICSLSMLLLGVYFYLDHVDGSIVENITWLPLVLLVSFFIGYDIGFGIIPNALIGEMFTTNVRSKGSALTLATSWIIGFLVTTAFGSLVKQVGGYTCFWIFAAVSGFAVVFTIFFIPETKGKSLLEIQDILSK